MKILCVIDSLGPGGAQRQLVELGLGLKERGHDISFLIYHNITFYKSILDKARIQITCIRESSYLKRLFNIRHFIRQGNYDAVFSFLEAPNLYCEISGLPFRKWILIVGERSANPNILKSFKLRMFRWFHIFADYVVANSNANIQIIRSINPLLSDSKCKVIYNIVDFSHWKPSHNHIPRIDGKLRIVVVASHRYLKNLKGLIEAFSMLTKEEQSKMKIDWYGDRLTKPYFDDSLIEAKRKIFDAKLEEHISFRSATIELVRNIQKADVIGLFSFYEGLPNSICEGMACAKPIICSAVSDIPNFLSYDPNLLFDPFDTKSIKSAIRYLISLSNDQLDHIGLKNLSIAKEVFDKERIISSYLKLISS